MHEQAGPIRGHVHYYLSPNSQNIFYGFWKKMPARAWRRVKRWHAIYPAFITAYGLYEWANWQAEKNARSKWF